MITPTAPQIESVEKWEHVRNLAQLLGFTQTVPELISDSLQTYHLHLLASHFFITFLQPFAAASWIYPKLLAHTATPSY